MLLDRKLVQTKCKCGDCARCRVQRKANHSRGPRRDPAEGVNRVLRSSGQRLPDGVRSGMEARFGFDFESVRVHDDAQSRKSALDLGARAYTSGRHIVFGAGEFNPESSSGQELLAHELAHVVQQSDPSTEAKIRGGGAEELYEQRADDMARRVLRSPREEARPERGEPPQRGPIQRQALEDSETSIDLSPLPALEDDGAFDGDSPPGGPLYDVGDELDVEGEEEEEEERALEAEVGEVAAGPIVQTSRPRSARKHKVKKGENLTVIARTEGVSVQALRDANPGKIGKGDVIQIGAVLTIPATSKSKKTKSKKTKSKKAFIKTINIDLSAQTLQVVWSDGTKGPVRDISSGRGLPDTKGDPCKDPNKQDSNCTPSGDFTVGKKGDASYKNKKGDKMSWYVELEGSGATGRGIGIHDSQPVTGSPRSHGCIRIDPTPARVINQNVTSRTRVKITGKAPTKAWKKKKK